MKPPKAPILAAVILVAVVVSLAGCDNGPGSSPQSDTPSAASALSAPVIPSASGTPGTPATLGSEVKGTLTNGTTWVADLPQSWNGVLLLYSHGYGPAVAADAPDANTQSVLLDHGYALAGSSYDPNTSQYALDTAVGDQFGTLAAVEAVLPRRPAHVLAWGTSEGGLVSALEAQQGQGRIDGALTTCGAVAGGLNLVQYQLDGEYAIAQLLGSPGAKLAGFDYNAEQATAAALTVDAQQAQGTAAGKARLALAMAFLNIPAWDPSYWAPVPGSDPAAQEAAQYDAMLNSTLPTISFAEGGRLSIEQAAGGQPAWTAGTNFTTQFANSPYKQEVEALYQAAGLNLDSDLATLTAHASIKANPAALKSLRATSDPTGRLEVPELDLHTIGDNIVPVQSENYYAQLVTTAGSGALLRQAYTEAYGHCNFSASEQLASVQALLHRVTTGQWGSAATAASLEAAATALNLDPAHFTAYSPEPLTGAVP